MVGRVILFTTSNWSRRTVLALRKLLKGKGISVDPDYFYAHMLHIKGRVEAAREFGMLMDLGYLKKEHYENWRHGRVPYLERVCTVNLSKLSTIRHEMRVYARKAGLKPSFCFYKQWAVKGKTIPLRFSKYGKEEIEKQYATHFVDSKRVAELKSQCVKAPAEAESAGEENE